MSSILNTYNRKKLAFKRGKGSYLYGTNGKKYLDFVQGVLTSRELPPNLAAAPPCRSVFPPPDALIVFADPVRGQIHDGL